MQHNFTILRRTRENILKIVNNFDLEQLNAIPQGLNNNLAWNLGHVIVTQQLLCYRLSGLDCHVTNEVISDFRKGSRPESKISQASIDQFKTQLHTLVDQTEKDYQAGVFKEYKTYTTSFGITLASAEEAIRFNNVHEAMHLGNMIIIKKLIG